MIIKWLGHASFCISLQNGTKILTDPYEAGFRGIINYSPIKEAADIVTVSHEHGDHNHVAGLPGKPEVVRGAGAQQAGGIEFTGIASYHDKVNGNERGPNTIFCFVGDDLRVCHLGDLGHALSDEQISALGDIDILLIPTGGPAATMELDEARELCQKVRPKVIVPMHFKNDKCSFPPYGVEDFIAGMNNVKMVNAFEVELTKENLPETTQIMVLDHAL
ncbi:MAG: MBL fold metallo-hydrolase [Deltaproteobacteria bacterium]|nr:MBL fold metallo-hydrolase [Deltaproteobacteria bacterium]